MFLSTLFMLGHSIDSLCGVFVLAAREMAPAMDGMAEDGRRETRWCRGGCREGENSIGNGNMPTYDKTIKPVYIT